VCVCVAGEALIQIMREAITQLTGQLNSLP
jgi:hypothetical protein